MNPTLKEATVRRYPYETHDQLQGHLATFLAADNLAKRLKTLRGLTSSHLLRTHLQMLDRKSGSVQAQSTPPLPGLNN
jgi:hypothetical protein